jgi:hypothetical protein
MNINRRKLSDNNTIANGSAVRQVAFQQYEWRGNLTDDQMARSTEFTPQYDDALPSEKRGQCAGTRVCTARRSKRTEAKVPKMREK